MTVTEVSDSEVSIAGYIVNKDKCSDRCMHMQSGSKLVRKWVHRYV